MTRAIQSLHKTLQLMIIYQPIKFGCQKISTSVDVVEMAVYDRMSVIKLGHHFFLHDTQAYNVASPHQVWLQKVQWFRRYQSNIHWHFEPLL